MKIKKIALMLVMALSINMIGASFVFAASPKSTTITTIDTSTQNENNIVQPQWKATISKAALKRLLKALDSPSNIQSIKSAMKAIGLVQNPVNK